MAKAFQVDDDELMFRAELYYRYYEVPQKDAFQILKRLRLRESDPHPYHLYLEFEPDFEEALRYLAPRVAIGLFKSADLDVLSELLKKLRSAASDLARPMVDIEELGRWETEKIYLSD